MDDFCQEAARYRNDKQARLMLEQQAAIGRMRVLTLKEEGASKEEIAEFEAWLQDAIDVRAGCMLLKGLLM